MHFVLQLPVLFRPFGEIARESEHHCTTHAEIAALSVEDLHQNRGFDSLWVMRKGGVRDALAIHPTAAQRIRAYLEAAGQADDIDGPLFRPLKKARSRGATWTRTPSTGCRANTPGPSASRAVIRCVRCVRLSLRLRLIMAARLRMCSGQQVTSSPAQLN